MGHRRTSGRVDCVCAKGFAPLHAERGRVSAEEAQSRTRLKELRAEIQTVSYDYAVGGVERCKTVHRAPSQKSRFPHCGTPT